MPRKLDWFPLYVKDLMMSRKVSKMNNEEFGIYIKLLCHQWLDGYLPDDMDELANMCSIVVGAMISAWDHVGPCFKKYNQGYLNPFLEDVRKEQETRHEKASRAGKIGAEAMWAKKRKERDRNATAMRPPSEGNSELMPVEKSREENSIEETTDPVGEVMKSFGKAARQSTDFRDWCCALEIKTGGKQGWNKKYKARWDHAIKHLGLKKMLSIIENLEFKNVEYLLTGPDGNSRGILVEATDEAIRELNRTG